MASGRAGGVAAGGKLQRDSETDMSDQRRVEQLCPPRERQDEMFSVICKVRIYTAHAPCSLHLSHYQGNYETVRCMYSIPARGAAVPPPQPFEQFVLRGGGLESRVYNQRRETPPPKTTDTSQGRERCTRRWGCFKRASGCLQGATLKLALATVVMALIQIQAGTVFCFSGITLPQLTNTTSDLYLDPYQAALFGSLVNLGALAGTCMSWPLLVLLGQRTTLQISLPLSLMFWFVLVFSPVTWMLQVSRFFLGFTMNLLTPSANLYLLEISHEDVRGRLLGVMTLSRNIGGLVVTLIGTSSLSWRHVGLACSSLIILPILGVLFLPNAPRWLMMRGRVTEARHALTFFRGKCYDPELEVQAITEHLDSDAVTTSRMWKQVQLLFKSPTLYTFCVLSGVTLIVTFCGTYALSAYLVPILNETKSGGDPYISAVIYNCLRVVGIVINLSVIDRLGRKPLIIFSFLLCALCSATYATYHHLLSRGIIYSITWLPHALLHLFSLFSGIGLPVITVLQGELLPTNCRATGISLLTCFLMLGGFTSSHTYLMTAEKLGQDGVFWLYSGFSFCLVLVSIFGIPETRGRTLEEISNQLRPPDAHKAFQNQPRY